MSSQSMPMVIISSTERIKYNNPFSTDQKCHIFILLRDVDMASFIIKYCRTIIPLPYHNLPLSVLLV